MYHNDLDTALEELQEEAQLPNPVHLRDLILRRELSPEQALEINRQFVEYQKTYGEMLQQGSALLKALSATPSK